MTKHCLHSIILLILLTGCNNSHVDKINRGGGFNFEKGLPELRLLATGFINEQNETYINVSGDVVFGSLIYTSSEDGNNYEAEISIDIAIKKDGSRSKSVADTLLKRTLSFENNTAIYNQDVYHFQQNFDVPPGNYLVEVALTDLKSRKQTVQTSETNLPDPGNKKIHITEILISGKNSSESDDRFDPVTTYDVPGKLDSLKFTFQVTNNDPDNPVELETRLLKFRSDQSIADPVYHMNPSNSSIVFKGIEYDKYDVIFNSTRKLYQKGSVFIEYFFSDLERGNYRMEVNTAKKNDGIYKGLDFAIRSSNYPSIKTPEEMARPLRYLMTEKEFDNLNKIQNPDSLQIAIERFWLSNIQNSVVARQVISLFYERVEEANKQFSNFKEGWKTDPGMVYILFGPPWYLDIQMTYMEWAYSYNPYESEKIFIFEQNKLKSKFFPFNHYVLDRSIRYHTLQYQQIQDWRSGRILNRNL